MCLKRGIMHQCKKINAVNLQKKMQFKVGELIQKNMKKLIDLLTALNAETTKVEEKFKEIAQELMNYYQIKSVSGEEFNIYEIEFYFFNENHKDPSVHCHNMGVGKWRVHYSGLDITFEGLKDSSYYGGILIRSIGNSKKIIVGPLRVQTTLLSGGSISVAKGISLIKVENCNNIREMKTSSRCGVMNLKNFDNDKQYCYYNADILKDTDRSDGTKHRIQIK